MDKIKRNKLEKDIGVICDYLKDEQKHYEESGRPQNHIWNYVKRMRQWLRNNRYSSSEN